ncbi:MAG: molybdopterin oxidoreductase family protein, partial [Fimbriimonadaceae bacterium]|nr:molybdopterin oxidoreductase family protein [Alphaproteobacteria bacterium]
DRLTQPLRLVGEKGSTDFTPISWDDALDIVAEKFLAVERNHGAEAVWPYFYAGTMGLVQRDGINRLRHVKKYSGMFGTFCSVLVAAGFMAGTGKIAGSDPREMAESDLIVIWGINPVATQVNVMTHVAAARKKRGAKVIVVDVYENATMKQADVSICIKPGTDGALACAIMHVLFRDGYANRDYLEKYTDCPGELEAHLQSRSPEWASDITGLSVEEIESFARAIGQTERTYFRMGYGFSRSRNGSTNVHAVLSIPAVTGAWLHKGGGAFYNNGGIYGINKGLIEGMDAKDSNVRVLDQSRIGAVLNGNPYDLGDGPPVMAMLIQNTNPATVAPDQNLVRKGLARTDLFTCVHEQFLTETARYADIVLPATMFLEHDDLYVGGGHQYLSLGPKLIDAPGECRSNHEVICALAKRVGAEHPGFDMTAREMLDQTLQASKHGTFAELEKETWRDIQPSFEDAHYINGFAYPDGKYRFKPDWLNVRSPNDGPKGPHGTLPALPDHWDVIEDADTEHPFRLATSPSRSFLNTSFNNTPSSIKREGRPEVLIHPEDARKYDIADGQKVMLGNQRGEVILHAKYFDGVQKGVLISEGVWHSDYFDNGIGINALTGADQPAPYGGAAFHDNHVWLRAAG